jgi:hypothetical protein
MPPSRSHGSSCMFPWLKPKFLLLRLPTALLMPQYKGVVPADAAVVNLVAGVVVPTATKLTEIGCNMWK